MSKATPGAASRGRLLLWLLVVTPLGFATKEYVGPGQEWVNASAGGLLYVVFWVLVAGLVWPRAATWRVAVVVLLVTCALETLQLWHPPFLDRVRETFVGNALLGSTFSWWDFPHYVAGAAIAAAIVKSTRGATS